jgi:hypothetical protein
MNLSIKILFAIFFLTKNCISQTIYESYDGFTVPTTPVLPVQEVHPSIWFKSSQIPEIKNKKNIDTYANNIWSYVNTLIFSYLTKTPSQQGTSTRPMMAKIMAFAWLINGDTTARRKAIECLMIAYNNVPRTAISSSFSGEYDEIYRATWLQNYCAAYDWVQPQLTQMQNDTIRKKLIEEVLLLRNNMISGVKYANRPHNHRSKPAWAIITGALTFTSDTRASDWLQFGLTQANTVTKYQFSSDGIYREGSHYNMYNMVNCIPYLWHYKNVSGIDHFQFYKPAFELPIRIRDGKGWLPNIEDSYVKPFPTHMVAAQFKQTITTLHPTEPLAKILQWNWFTTNFISHDYTGATNDVVWDIDEYITYDPSIQQISPQIPPTQKTKSGVVVFRDNLNYSTQPSKYLLFHAVAECDNHQHPDLLSYVLEYNNTILATDPGYGKDGYDDTKRYWYVAPYAHNCVTVDSIGPLDLSINVPPKDLHFINSTFYDFSEKEARITIPNGKIIRGIAFPNKKYWVVYDIGFANIPSTYRLYIHSRGSMTRNGNQVTWLTSNDSYGTSQKLHTFILSSSPNTIINKTGWTSLFKDEPQQNYVEVTQTSSNAMFLHLLYPDNSTSQYPDVVNIGYSDVLAFQLTSINDKDIFAVQATNQLRNISTFSTDGIFTWVNTSNNSLKKFSVNEGKIFYWNGVEIVSFDHNSSFAIDETNSKNIIMVLDTLKQQTTIQYKPIVNADSISAVLFNHISIPYGIVNGKIVVTISGQGTLQFLSGVSDTFDEGVSELPKNFNIVGNYPNPFNNSTRIRFQINNYQPFQLRVFDSLGKLVRNLLSMQNSIGTFDYEWNGKDDNGVNVTSGIYYFELSNGVNIVRKKGILLK